MDITLKPIPSPYLAPFLPRHHHHKTQLNQQQFRQIKDEPTAILACSAKCNGGTGRFSKSATSPFINDLFFLFHTIFHLLCVLISRTCPWTLTSARHTPPPSSSAQRRPLLTLSHFFGIQSVSYWLSLLLYICSRLDFVILNCSSSFATLPSPPLAPGSAPGFGPGLMLVCVWQSYLWLI